MTLTTDNATTITTQRAFATHTPMWQRFQTDVTLSGLKTLAIQGNNVYQRQYSHVYAQRLAALKPLLFKSVSPSIPRVARVLDLREDDDVARVIVGTIVKECLNEKEAPLEENKTCRPSDVLYLEDESGRVTLETNQVHDYPTGVVLAVEGVVKEGGILHVSKFYTPFLASPPTVDGELKSGSIHNNETEEKLAPHVLLVSGLNCAAPGVCSLTRDMLLQYLQGTFSLDASKVCRVVICGNSISPTNTIEGVKELDGWIAQVCATGIPITLLPGQDDPSTANWPQRPLHSSLFKYGGSFLDKSLLERTPNPMACGLGNKYMVGTDGRNVADLFKQISEKTELEALKFTLTCGHVCPTGPSSVPTVPLGEVDPMVMEETPHVYFAGNCHEFATDLVVGESGESKTRIVCVPKFAETGKAVLVNLETLDCELLCFEDEL